MPTVLPVPVARPRRFGISFAAFVVLTILCILAMADGLRHAPSPATDIGWLIDPGL